MPGGCRHVDGSVPPWPLDHNSYAALLTPPAPRCSPQEPKRPRATCACGSMNSPLTRRPKQHGCSCAPPPPRTRRAAPCGPRSSSCSCPARLPLPRRLQASLSHAPRHLHRPLPFPPTLPTTPRPTPLPTPHPCPITPRPTPAARRRHRLRRPRRQATALAAPPNAKTARSPGGGLAACAYGSQHAACF